MTQALHTPGPWDFDTSPRGYVAIRETRNEGNTAVAVALAHRPFEQIVANARLIAAAPDMLEALEMCYAYVAIPSVDFIATYGNLEADDMAKRLQPILDRARAS